VTTSATGAGPLVAILDDEEDIRELVAVALRSHGFRTVAFGRPQEFLSFMETHRPDLIILDLMLPGADGFEVCRSIKSRPDQARIPLIMLTARVEESDRVCGLELGADDYVPKPFSPRELAARVKAVLRRSLPLPEGPAATAGRLDIDLRRHEMRIGGMPLELTMTEFKILALLASRPGWVFSREAILDHLWGSSKAVIPRTVDVHIRNLRAKMGVASAWIRPVRGIGYRILHYEARRGAKPPGGTS